MHSIPLPHDATGIQKRACRPLPPGLTLSPLARCGHASASRASWSLGSSILSKFSMPRPIRSEMQWGDYSWSRPHLVMRRLTRARISTFPNMWWMRAANLLYRSAQKAPNEGGQHVFLNLTAYTITYFELLFFAIAMHIILRHFIWFMSFGPFFLLLRVVTSFSSASCKTVSETQLVRSGARFVASKMDAILDKALLSQSSNKEWGVTRECTASSFSGSRFACFVTLCVEPRWRKQPYSFVH